jgi:hypothetical protein
VGFRLIAGDYLGAGGDPSQVRPGLRRSRRARWHAGRAHQRDHGEETWPGETAVGRRFRAGRDTSWVTVVGIVGDVRHRSLTEAPEAEMYQPTTQSSMPALMVAVKTSVPPVTLVKTVQSTVWAVDPGVPSRG